MINAVVSGRLMNLQHRGISPVQPRRNNLSAIKHALASWLLGLTQQPLGSCARQNYTTTYALFATGQEAEHLKTCFRWRNPLPSIAS